MSESADQKRQASPRERGVVKKGSLRDPNITTQVTVLGRRHLLVVSGRCDERIATVAAVQRGRISRRQLVELQVSASAIKRLARRGRLIRLHAGVYAVGHAADVELGRETAAVLAVHGPAILSGHTAAPLWKLRPAQPRGAPVHLTVAGATGAHKPGIVCHRTTSLHPKDIRIRQGLPIASPALTLLQIATEITVNELQWALDEALSSNVMTISQLLELLDRSSGRPGAGLLRALYEHRGGPTPTRSMLEKRFVLLIVAAHLPNPETNVMLHGFLVDAYWPELGVVFEIDSHRYHSTRSAFERDRRKEAVLKSHGLDFNRVSDYQLENEPYAVVAFVAQRLALAQRRAA
jgi:predicted transcriptional regulator of viral defense system